MPTHRPQIDTYSAQSAHYTYIHTHITYFVHINCTVARVNVTVFPRDTNSALVLINGFYLHSNLLIKFAFLYKKEKKYWNGFQPARMAQSRTQFIGSNKAKQLQYAAGAVLAHQWDLVLIQPPLRKPCV